MEKKEEIYKSLEDLQNIIDNIRLEVERFLISFRAIQDSVEEIQSYINEQDNKN